MAEGPGGTRVASPPAGWRRLAVGLVALASVTVPVAGRDDTVLKNIPLRHRPARHLLEVLRPLVAPEGSVDALDTRIVVRATPAALDRVQQAVLCGLAVGTATSAPDRARMKG